MTRRFAGKVGNVARVAAFTAFGVGGATILAQGGCLVTEHCYSNADCTAPQLCMQNGTCRFECERNEDCGEAMRCYENRCSPMYVEPIECPPEMANVADAFCVDRFEASRPDATATTNGTDNSRAMSRAGVMPWQLFAPEDNETARSACLAAGKDLCTPQQWRSSCEGRAGTAYGYGDTYEPETCNGIDTFGLSGFHLLPTASLPRCHSDWGVYDINGNLWEHTLNGDEKTIRGGAYNCKDSQTLHRCDYIPTSWEPTARGFRCCLVPSGTQDAGADVDEPDVLTDVATDTEVGCIDDTGTPDVVLDAPADVLDAHEAGQDAMPDGPSEAEAGSQGCPSDMVRIVAGTLDFCMDVYEASHMDATAASQGTLPVASSRKDVLPWFPVDLQTARDGCTTAGKRLCALDEWVEGCSGPSSTVYGYGNNYDPAICNGIDTYCNCGGAVCGSLATCPYPHCFNQASTEGAGPCGAMFHVEPTGTFLDCTSAYGVFDINGNVWELADSSDGLEHFRGGAYNCSDSEALHRCDHDGTWGPSARGFRCCKDPE